MPKHLARNAKANPVHGSTTATGASAPTPRSTVVGSPMNHMQLGGRQGLTSFDKESKLAGNNHSTWKVQTKVNLEAFGLWEGVEPNGAMNLSPAEDSLIRAWIFGNCKPMQQQLIEDCTTAREMVQRIEDHFTKNNHGAAKAARMEMRRIKHDGNITSLEKHLMQMRMLHRRLQDLRYKMPLSD